MGYRRFSSVVALVAGAALTLAACSAGSTTEGPTGSAAGDTATSEPGPDADGGDGSTDADTDGQEPPTDGTDAAPTPSDGSLALGLVAAPANFDFTSTDGAAIPQLLLGNVYETLIVQDQDGSLIPGLAESWTESDDATTFTFTLREGVTFSDGTPFTAEDAAFSIDRVQNHWTVGVARAMDVVESVEVTSPTELVVTLSHPDALWLFKMTTRIGAMFSQAHVDDLAIQAIGTGPFTVEPFSGADQITLTRHDGYWGTPSQLKTIVFKYFSDASAMNNALLTGDIQVITTVQTPQALAQFESDDRYQIINGTTNGTVMMTINNMQPPLDDVRVRQAINYALDKDAILRAAWAGYGTVIGSHEVPTDPWFVDLADRYPHDVDKAKELLAEAGQEDLTLTLSVPTLPYAQAAAPIIVSQLAEAGITVDAESLTFPDNWLAQVFSDPYDYDLTIINHVEQYDLTTVFSGEDDYYTRYVNPEVARLEAEGLSSDQETFIDDFRQVVTILADDAAAAWLWAFPNLMVADVDVEGLPENAIGESFVVSALTLN